MGLTQKRIPNYTIFTPIDKTGYPCVWIFDTAEEVGTFLWGRHLPYLAIFKGKRLIKIEGGEVKEIEQQLEAEASE